MKIVQNVAEKRCEIWIFNSEKATYKQNDNYISAVADAKAKKYLVCTFISGEEELLPLMHQILDAHNYTLSKASQ